MEGTYRGNLVSRVIAIFVIVASVALVFLLSVAPDEELADKELRAPAPIIRLFLAWASLLATWISLWLLTERVEIHKDRIVYSVCGLTTVVRYENITFFLPKVLKGFRRRITRGLYLSNAHGNTIFALGCVKHVKEIADYIPLKCDSPKRRAGSVPTNLRITYALVTPVSIVMIVGVLFMLGVL